MLQNQINTDDKAKLKQPWQMVHLENFVCDI